MPPRKRPTGKSGSATASATTGPSIHLQPFLAYLENECGLSQNTLRAYNSDLRQFFAWYALQGKRSLADVDLDLLTNYLDHLRDRGLAPPSAARHLASLKMFFRYLVLEGVLQESVVDVISAPKLWESLPKILSPENVDRLLSAPCREDRFPLRDRALLSLLYATGCRASEVTALKCRDVVLEDNYCRCIGKGDKERLVSLNPVARAAVEAYFAEERPRLASWSDAEWVFLTRRGQQLSRIMVWKLVKKYAARIGAGRKVSPHTLRHSFATHMLAGGAEIRALQEMLGHANIATTQLYTQVEHGRLKAVHQHCHPRG